MQKHNLSTALLALYIVAGSASAAPLSVAVASNFTAPMQEIAQVFEKKTGHTLALSFGSTGKFYAQIRQAAPFEVLFAADAATPARIGQEGLGVEASRLTYAIGTLVLWSPQPGLIDDGPEVLTSERFARLAIANPDLAPYGAAARQTLEHLGLFDKLQSRFVMGSNISQTYQFVATRNAQLGLVALSQVYAGGRIKEGSAWIVPSSYHQAIRQDAIILNPGKTNPVAGELMQFMQSELAQKIIESYGYRR